MFDIGFAEIIVISAVTLVVIGPKEIPNVVRGVVKGLRHIRGYVNEFQSGVSDFVDSTGVNDIKDDFLKDDDFQAGTGQKSWQKNTDNWQDDFAVGGEEPDPYAPPKTEKKSKPKKSKAKKAKAKKTKAKKSMVKKSMVKKSMVKKSTAKKSAAKKSAAKKSAAKKSIAKKSTKGKGATS